MLKLCVIGDPVGHSKSPAIHRELLKTAHLEGTYEAVTVTPDTLEDFIAAARAGEWDGFNVTMPLKTAIIPLLDGLDITAQDMGAVNTVAVRRGVLTGYNTDGPGFVQTLPFDPVGKKALVLGNGGASHAVAVALRRAGARVTVCCRHPRGEEKPWDELRGLAAKCDLLVNATPLGMEGKGQFEDFTFLDALPEKALVYDLVYHPMETQFLRRAETMGHPVIGGYALLQAQAELSFRLFTE